MKNREKYREEILSFMSKGDFKTYCEFSRKHVIPNLTDVTNGGCTEFSCNVCRALFAFWLDEEYEVDWSKVPVDTLVRVKDFAADVGVLRYFKGIDDSNPVERFVAWADGKTSVTADGSCTNWAFCELVEDPNDK